MIRQAVGRFISLNSSHLPTEEKDWEHKCKKYEKNYSEHDARCRRNMRMGSRQR